MGKIQWVKWKNRSGCKHVGSMVYDPPEPRDTWEKIMGVVARCEGNHDTVVSYDGTGVTWGFLQWTFTSGRLQKLLESFKSIPYHDLDTPAEIHHTLFDEVCEIENDVQIFEPYGFMIHSGKFIEKKNGQYLDPRNKAQKQRIDDICMGRARYKTFKEQQDHAMRLATVFVDLAQQFGVASAQIQFAVQEFKRELQFNRPPLNGNSIAWLLDGTWETPASALFFNLWQNSPSAAYTMFKSVKNSGAAGDDYFELAWKKTCLSKFGNWGYGKPENKSPRAARIQKAMKEFYGIDLKLYK